eukprot:gene13916-16417_t
MQKRTLLDGKKFQITIKRLCHQLIENHTDFSNTVLIGIQPRGSYFADRVKMELSEILKNNKIQKGNLDITFFRDDFRRKDGLVSASSNTIDFIIEGKNVILIDDVLWTGRTIRAALDALLAYGRPAKVELMVLIDRRFSRHVPIEPDYIGQQVDSLDSQLVRVKMAAEKLSTRHLLGIKDIDRNDIELIFETADNFKEVINRPIKKVPSLRDITIANIFFENSTRTKLSFELAEKRLSADIVNFAASSSSVSKGETLIDTVNNILAMKVDMVVMRHPYAGAGVFLSKHINAQIVNAGDGAHEHPTQALLDAFSIRQKLGDVAGKKVVIVGDILHSRVAISNILCLQKLGAEVMVCGPTTLIPKFINGLGVKVEHDLRKALNWCDVANMLRIQLERQDIKYFPSLREYAMMYGLNKQILDSLDKEIVVMHPGPINRGVEITSDVADSKQSIILEQVENGVAVRMAVLYLLASQRD